MLPSSSSVSEERAKNRRIRQDDSWSGQSTTGQNLIEFGYTSQQYGVGCPPLFKRPVLRFQVDSTGPEHLNFTLKLPQMRRAVLDNGVRFDPQSSDEILLVQTSIQESSERDLTILINALWEDDSQDTWERAVDAVKSIIMTTGALKDAYVELKCRQFSAAKTYGTIGSGHAICRLYEDSIRPGVKAALGANEKLSEGYYAINVLLIGRDGSDELSGYAVEGPVTIQIIIDLDLEKRDWIQAKLEIDRVLRDNNCGDVAVSFEYGTLY